MACEACAKCHNPLVFVDADSDDEADESIGRSSAEPSSESKTVPDDVQPRCGCHFHWQCLLESTTNTNCPSCSNNIITEGDSGAQILCNINNEGGLQEGVDLLSTLTEEAYCNAHPRERKSRAFLAFCRNGDLPAIAEMLQNDDDDEDDQTPMPNGEVLRYQDPIGSQQSGLHAAVESKSREVVWLLLLLASKLDLQALPAEVFQEAGVLGVMRDDVDVEGRPDIRSLVDAEGRTAEQLAAVVGPPFHDWIGHGILGV